MQAYVKDHREYLKREFRTRVQRRPLYSQRAFARDLGLSPSSLTEYLKGKIRLSPGRVVQISRSLGLSHEQSQHWVDLIESQSAKNSEQKALAQIRIQARLQAQSHSLTLDQYKVISDWYHFAYLELIEMDAAHYSDPKTAAQALGIPLRTMKLAIQRLQAGGLLRTRSNGLFEVDPSTTIGDQTPSQAIRDHHTQVLKKAIRAMETQAMDRRVNSSTFIALPKQQIPKLVEELRTAAFKILEPHLQASQNQHKSELYCLSLHFFDLLQTTETSK